MILWPTLINSQVIYLIVSFNNKVTKLTAKSSRPHAHSVETAADYTAVAVAVAAVAAVAAAVAVAVAVAVAAVAVAVRVAVARGDATMDTRTIMEDTQQLIQQPPFTQETPCDTPNTRLIPGARSRAYLRTLNTVFTRTASLNPCQAMLHHFTEAQLYTDGNTFKGSSVEDFLKGKELTRATGAIVGTDDGDNYTATRIDFTTTTKLKPNLTELVTTMYARRRSTAEIVSDCQGSLHRARVGRRPKGSQGHITAAYSWSSIRDRTEARWVHSHPEPDKSKSGRWSLDDFGIWLADGMAGKELGERTHRGKTITSLQVGLLH